MRMRKVFPKQQLGVGILSAEPDRVGGSKNESESPKSEKIYVTSVSMPRICMI